jgi:hypothetical protein
MNRCQHCDQPITLLNSQKNGVLDCCLTCALDRAAFVRFTLKRKGQVIDDEIVCRRHYQQHSRDGFSMAPLSEREKLTGMTQTVVPYEGDHGCHSCEDEAMHQAKPAEHSQGAA